MLAVGVGGDRWPECHLCTMLDPVLYMIVLTGRQKKPTLRLSRLMCDIRPRTRTSYRVVCIFSSGTTVRKVNWGARWEGEADTKVSRLKYSI